MLSPRQENGNNQIRQCLIRNPARRSFVPWGFRPGFHREDPDVDSPKADRLSVIRERRSEGALGRIFRVQSRNRESASACNGRSHTINVSGRGCSYGIKLDQRFSSPEKTTTPPKPTAFWKILPLRRCTVEFPANAEEPPRTALLQQSTQQFIFPPKKLKRRSLMQAARKFSE